jgi:hypothetical protein
VRSDPCRRQFFGFLLTAKSPPKMPEPVQKSGYHLRMSTEHDAGTIVQLIMDVSLVGRTFPAQAKMSAAGRLREVP